MHLSNLINNLPPYHFADAKKKIADRKAAGVDVINLSMGDPDLPAPQAVIDRLCATLQDPENHRYPEYFGMRALHLAFASWFKQRFDVRLTPEQDTLPLLGSKEGLAYVGPPPRALTWHSLNMQSSLLIVITWPLFTTWPMPRSTLTSIALSASCKFPELARLQWNCTP